MDEREIFAKAIEIKDLERRAKWLDEATGENRDLRTRIDRLILSHQDADGFLEGSPLDEYPEVQQVRLFSVVQTTN